VGLITNRLTPYTIGDVLPSLTAFKDCPLFYGGPVGTGVQVLHRVAGLKDAREVCVCVCVCVRERERERERIY
jgi:putative AlgH/UPF0301 family transcriptional regulator